MRYKTGIELVTGIPGSGKSFFIVERLVDWILKEKRPVYTNLPLRHRVLKKYLKIKGGECSANLIYELTEERLNRFLSGFKDRQDYISRSLAAGQSRSHSIKLWEKANPNFDQWWIPAGSIIAIDEAHHWYPNPALTNVRKKEPESLMSFLTMHRHGQYLVVFVTQAERQVSTTVKSLVSTRFDVRRWDKEPLIGGITMEFINFPILKYDEYMGEDDIDTTKPLRSFTRLPRLPQYQLYFRLYESFTHAGGKYEAMREVEKKRTEAGIIEKMPKTNYTNRVSKWIIKWLIRFLLIITVSLVAYRCGKGRDVIEIPNKDLFTIKGISTLKVYTDDGSELKVGDSIQGAKLTYIKPDKTTYWRYKNGYYTLQVGDVFNPVNTSKLPNRGTITPPPMDN